MEKTFDILRATRENFLKLTADLSTNEWNEIPASFNNNILWNFGHITASLEVLCYRFSNIQPFLEDAYIEKYKNGTKPDGHTEINDIEIVKKYAVTSLDQLIIDFRSGLFKTYNPYTTRFGVELTRIEDAIQYISVHDTLHYGVSLTLKKLIRRR